MSPSTKGRVQQKLRKRVAREIAAIRHPRNPAGHDWLQRHVERQNGLCAYCGIAMQVWPLRGEKRRKGLRASLDHIVPLARGGPDSESNTVAACEACNSAKGSMTAQMFRLSEFCIARKALVATLPKPRPKPAKVTVTLLKRPRQKPKPQ